MDFKKMLVPYFPKKKLQHLSEFGTRFWLMQSKLQMADILSLLLLSNLSGALYHLFKI